MNRNRYAKLGFKLPPTVTNEYVPPAVIPPIPPIDWGDDFVTTWLIPSDDLTLDLSLEEDEVGFIDWGDGTSHAFEGHTNLAMHDYAEAGEYVIRISGLYQEMWMVSGAPRITHVLQIGDTGWFNVESGLNTCENLQTVTTGAVCDLSGVDDMSWMLNGCTSLTSFTITNPDIFESITTISGMFYDCPELLSIDMSNMDISSISDFTYLFNGCTNLASVDCSNWVFGGSDPLVTPDVDLDSCFCDCTNLTNISSLSTWDTQYVIGLGYLFDGCESITTNPLSTWSLGNVNYINHVFNDCKSLESIDLNMFTNLPELSDMRGMFKGCESLTSLSINDFDISQVTSLSSLFMDCKNLPSVDISSWDTTNITNMSRLFSGCESFTSIDFTTINTVAVTNMDNIFENCKSIPTSGFNLDNLNTVNATRMNAVFKGCESITSWDFPTIVPHSATTMNSFFEGCINLNNPTFTLHFEMDHVMYMNNFFKDCTGLITLDFNITANRPLWRHVNDLTGLFDGCTNLNYVDLVHPDYINSQTSVDRVFKGCSTLRHRPSLWISTTGITSMNELYSGCSSMVTTIVDSQYWTRSPSVTSHTDCFKGCTSSTNYGTIPNDWKGL